MNINYFQFAFITCITCLAIGSIGPVSQACAQAILPTSSEEHVLPNNQLVAQAIPPIPRQIAKYVERYTEFRGHSFVGWHPHKREMLVSHRPQGSSVSQIFRLSEPLGTLEPITSSDEPVRFASYEPKHARYIVYSKFSGGNEASQLYRKDLDELGSEVLLTNPDERHTFHAWNRFASTMIYSSVPLDRTAKGGSRKQISTSLREIDPLRIDSSREIAQLPGVGWFAGEVSPDGRFIVVNRYISANESEVWLLDLASGARQRLLPKIDDKEPSIHFAGEFLPDQSGLVVLTDRHGEFREASIFDFKSASLNRLTSHIPWDIAAGSLSRDGGRLALLANEDGKRSLRLLVGKALTEYPAVGLPEGSLDAISFHEREPLLAFGVRSAQSPGVIYSYQPESGVVLQWTKPYAHPDVDVSAFAEQSIIRWQSFDSRSISGLISRPPARFTGKRPVLIDIHGGPEAQSGVEFLGRMQFFVQDLGIAVIRPNVRGSTGFGKRFVALDNGRLREDAVKDIGALLDWIAGQPDLDASKVVVAGGSYGGYMSLATAVHYSDRIAGAINVVGISHFVTFLETTESYRRDLRRVEYGDERDPEMRAFLHSISPLTNAARITKPLFVIQGKNDPRVPYTEAEQIVAEVRKNGTSVWYLRAENEGHGFARKENADFQFYAMVIFLKRYLLGEAFSSN
jgi:dipeptidyl aminopeptidase/acylaminoacyl peptidase